MMGDPLYLQSKAIERYIARKCGLLGESEEQVVAAATEVCTLH
jgi:hypothetical protein